MYVCVEGEMEVVEGEMEVVGERWRLWRERQCHVSVCVCVCFTGDTGCLCGGETALCVCMEKWVCWGREIVLRV